MINKIELDIVHPCFNPHKGWHEELLYYFNIFISKLPPNVNVYLYLVDDGSSHGITTDQIEYLNKNIKNFDFIRYSPNAGKGFALRTAIKQTKGEYVIYTDADYPYRMENAWEMFRLLTEEKYDVVLGIRDNHYYSQLPFFRKVLSLSMRSMNHIIFPRIVVKDTQSGLKGFNRKGKKVFLNTKINSFLFDLEFVVLVSRVKSLKVSIIKVHVRDGIKFSQMKTKTIVQELKSLKNIFLRLKRNRPHS